MKTIIVVLLFILFFCGSCVYLKPHATKHKVSKYCVNKGYSRKVHSSKGLVYPVQKHWINNQTRP